MTELLTNLLKITVLIFMAGQLLILWSISPQRHSQLYLTGKEYTS